jgi:hypothetical protein
MGHSRDTRPVGQELLQDPQLSVAERSRDVREMHESRGQIADGRLQGGDAGEKLLDPET